MCNFCPRKPRTLQHSEFQRREPMKKWLSIITQKCLCAIETRKEILRNFEDKEVAGRGGENVALEFQASVWGSDKGGKNNTEEEKSLAANFPFVGGIASSFFLLRIPSIPSRIAQFLHTFLWKKWFVCRCAALQIDAVFFQLVSFWECKVGVGEKKLCPECTHRNARHIVRPRMQTE